MHLFWRKIGPGKSPFLSPELELLAAEKEPFQQITAPAAGSNSKSEIFKSKGEREDVIDRDRLAGLKYVQSQGDRPRGRRGRRSTFP